MDKFTFEELALMRIFDTADREALRNELVAGLHDVDEYTDSELIALFGTTLEKLDELTSEEFESLRIYLEVEDFYTEEEAIDD